MLMFTLTTSVVETCGRCITHPANMSIDPTCIELTADVLRIYFSNVFAKKRYCTPDPRRGTHLKRGKRILAAASVTATGSKGEGVER